MASVYLPNDRPVAGFNYIPESLEDRGTLKPIAPLPGVRNGLGLQVTAGLAGFEWTWPYMTIADMQFWTTLLSFNAKALDPQYSVRFVNSGEALPAARLWGRNMVVVNYRVAVIDYPIWERFENNLFWGVMVKFHSLESTGA